MYSGKSARYTFHECMDRCYTDIIITARIANIYAVHVTCMKYHLMIRLPSVTFVCVAHANMNRTMHGPKCMHNHADEFLRGYILCTC